MGVRGNFGDFETALKNFTALALGGAQTPADPVKTAFAALYEKQFRYALYQSYEQKPVNQPPPAPKEATVAPTTAAAADQKPSATRITDPMTLAKNRFGDFLAALPEDKRHEDRNLSLRYLHPRITKGHTVFPAAILTVPPGVC
jgi:hypothetical protein